MRERAAAAGGTIEIGPLPGQGFRVAARFPLDPPELAQPAGAQPQASRSEPAASQKGGP
jgi:hypothetical protein